MPNLRLASPEQRVSASPPLRLGLIGCGRVVELGYVPAIEGLDGIELVAVADPSAERRELVARAAGGDGPPLATYPGAAELLERAAVEAVVVASPAAEHPAHAELASARGVGCLVEKPPAADVLGAERIAALPGRLWIGFNRRFQHGERLLATIPPAGSIELEVELRYRRASWRPLTVADDALLDLAPHLVDLALLGAGPGAASVEAAAVSPNRVELGLRTPRGRAVVRCASDRPYRERVVIRDREGGEVTVSVAGGPARALADRLPGREHPLVASLRAQLQAFGRAVRGGDPGLLATAADGLRTMRLIESARAAALRAAA